MSFCVYRCVAHGICLYDYTAIIQFSRLRHVMCKSWKGRKLSFKRITINKRSKKIIVPKDGSLKINDLIGV